MEEARATQPIEYWDGDRLVMSIAKDKPFVKLFKVLKNTPIYVQYKGVYRAVDCWDTYEKIQATNLAPYAVEQPWYTDMYTEGPLINWDDFQKIQPVLDKLTPPTAPAAGEDDTAFKLGSTVPKLELVLDVLYIPESLPPIWPAGEAAAGANTTQTTGAKEAQLWLTAGTPRIGLSTILSEFTDAQIEEIVTHLDPILQNALFQKIIAFIPPDIAHTLKLFDASNFPNVVSLLDTRHQNWDNDNCNAEKIEN
jgi:hypothetical protein